MKKKVSMLFAMLLCLGMGFTGCKAQQGERQEKTEELTKVTLNEVAHSIFYAPQYVAIEEGYFVNEGIKLELVTGFGADKVMSALYPVMQILVLWGQRQRFMPISRGLRIRC